MQSSKTIASLPTPDSLIPTPDSLGALSVGELNSPRVAPLPTPYHFRQDKRTGISDRGINSGI
ncbi:hypothetical protein [Moorena producens]|uniref:hypothetical protein n=1 Tax=Moorena producens TaxID=1155739 RepID=UPI003C77AAF9